ncbi:MAG: EAL domain-containing protein [Pseudomonadota bacterium]
MSPSTISASASPVETTLRYASAFSEDRPLFRVRHSPEERKRSLVDNVVRYAHALGISVIAEGIENSSEFYICRDLGCDLVQGYLIRATERGVERAAATL